MGDKTIKWWQRDKSQQNTLEQNTGQRTVQYDHDEFKQGGSESILAEWCLNKEDSKR